jgi:hypothetical protein
MMRPLEVLPAGGGGGGTPDCANVQVNTGPGKIIVNGLAGAPVTQLQIFNAAWQPFFSCFNDCGATKTVTAAPGTYYVKVKYFTATYQPICEVNVTVNVPLLLIGTQDEAFQLYVNKELEHTEVNWVHNAGYLVSQYELERSLDGTHFEPLVAELSKGGHSPELYNSYDLYPAIGDNYYRVKATLLDGTVGYSEARMVHFDDLMDFSLFPNPANGFVNTNLETIIGTENVTITIFNNLGLEMKRFQLDEVYSKYYQMDLRDLHEGHYIVWLNVPGKRPIAKTLMVGKI